MTKYPAENMTVGYKIVGFIQFILSKCFPQEQLVELTGTLEEERVRARRMQNERDVQQATAMERERQLYRANWRTRRRNVLSLNKNK